MVTLSRMQAYGLISTTVFVSTVINAFRQRSNFYAAAVYLSKSNACMMILWNQAIYQTVLFGKLLQLIFLGQLRLIEVERLQERGWFAVTETLLALTIFKDEFESTFVLLFVSLLFLKVFHWLASDRIEAMEQSANVSRLAHARMIGLLSLLWIADVIMVLFAADCILAEGPTVMIMFASEYMILVASVWQTSMKYIITCIDMRREVQWEEKSIYIFYVELVADFFKLVTYLTFFGLTLTFYGLPLNILRDVYLTLRSFLLRIRDLRRYRLATKNMDTLYPDATREEMNEMSDKTCIICREDMEFQPPAGGPVDVAAVPAPSPANEQARPEARAAATQSPRPAPRGPNETPKKLPCGHVFHFHCLKSWLERQQSCPTCRRPVLPQEQPAARIPVGARAGQRHGAGGPNGGEGAADPNGQDQALRQAQVNLARNLGREAFGVIFPNLPFPEEAARPGDAPANPEPTPNPTPTVRDVGSRAPPSPSQPAHDSSTGTEPPGTTSQTPSRPGTSASPVASTSTGRPPSSNLSRTRLASSSLLSPSSAPSPSGSDSPNPLARFSLPDLELPPTGEAGLYHAPPSFGTVDHLDPRSRLASGPGTSTHGAYADVAYGAFPQFGGRVTNVPPPHGYAAAGSTPRTLEERINQIRDKMSAAGGGRQPAAGEGVHTTDETGQAIGTEKQDKGKGKENAAHGADVEDVGSTRPRDPDAGGAAGTDHGEGEEAEGSTIASRREAALAAAERRRVVAPSSRAPSPSGSGWRLRKTDSLAPWSDVAHATPLPPSREPSPAPTPPASRRPLDDPSTSSSSSSSSTGAHRRLTTAVPRLIPLYDPLNPSAGSRYPALTTDSSSAAPAPSAGSGAAATAVAADVDRLVRRGIEAKLRMLVEFQDRLEGLVDEMRTSLGSIDSEEQGPGEGAGEERPGGGELEKVAVRDGADS
ncbi:hypothetical protein JCM11491_000201 [Sporobolomyces phaffii]